jgi:uncharacterized membrane protein YeaQ/YmgE (transglycosylase-associated protein family)
MSILGWAVFGLVAGVIANALDPHPSEGGVLGAIVLGILGAVVGGFLANMLFGVGISGFDLPSFAVAVLGSLLLLGIGRTVRRVE